MASADVEKAVQLFQLYDGSTSTSVKVAQRLYDKAKRAALKIAKKRGADFNTVFIALADEARKRGAIIPRPGKDY